MLVCSCYGVAESEICQAIEAGASDEEQVGIATAAGMNCGGCLDRICQLLDDANVSGHGLTRRVAS